MAVHYFNPETDYALAAGKSAYNPPARIRLFKERNMLLPAIYAAPGDAIAVDSLPSGADNPEMSRLASEKNLEIIRIDDVPPIIGSHGMDFRPWGWNHSIVNSLRKLGFPDDCLKTDMELDNIRLLSHRHTTIDFSSRLKTLMPENSFEIPMEFFSADSAISYLKKSGDCFIKLPWSSSGRGVVRASELTDRKLFQWVNGGIRRQGSVMIEKAYRKSIDFATEWWCSGGKAIFKGLSYFKASPSGRYISNTIAPQNKILELIKAHAPLFGHEIVETQKETLDTLISPHYSGPLGIDMLSTEEGVVVPCIEINLRMTMGHAYLQ